MSIYAIGDLHLSFAEGIEKPMDMFGPEWVNHAERLKENWINTISEDDTVILNGDISWGLRIEEALPDLDWIDALPGKKILIKGNHDLWWSSINKLNKLYENMFFLQNDYFTVGDVAICGTRGWLCPGDNDFTAHDEKIYNRELLRLRTSVEKATQAGFISIIGALHFPPTNDKLQRSGFTDIFSEYGVKIVIYGHLHGKEAYSNGLESILNGVEYRLVSLDKLKCEPLLVLE
jgi:predicted phosphohydrolase